MSFKHLFPVILLLLPFFTQGQQKEYQLNGYAYIKNGPVCRYYLEFTVSGSTISGYSVTTQPDGRDLKALINGSINTASHRMAFIESKMPLAFTYGDCMFDVQLSYQLTHGQYKFSGSFTGKNGAGDVCDEGTVKLAVKKELAGIFEKEKPGKRPKPIPVITPQSNDERPAELSKITATIHKEFEWHTDTCILEIWDGEVVDGDIVTLGFNGLKVLADYTLAADKKRLILPLQKKTNSITIFAENEGKAPPNTSMIQLYDGNMQYGVLACIKKGETAEIIIRRK